MSAKSEIKHGNEFPFDAPDEWWHDTADSNWDAKPKDWAHATARGIISDLQDRQGIKYGFNDIDEDTRKEIVKSLAAIIREGAKLIPHDH